MHSPMKRGFTLIELLVVIAIIAILASILFPVFSKAREKARQATCISQVRQIATAIQLYAQDNSAQYPGIDGGSWVSKLTNYLGNASELFQCPSDTTGDRNQVSYAIAGVLIRANGSGVKEASINSPSEVGCIADASPTETYPSGRLIGGGGLQDESAYAATPAPRHSKGIVAGFCDGHAKFFSGSFDEQDLGSNVTRAFYAVAHLGLIDNPLACINNTAVMPTFNASVTIGGEYVTYPLLMAAAQMGGRYYTRGFLGQNSTLGRPTTNYVWGTASSSPNVATSAIAYDGVCVIVAKSTKIPYLINTTPAYDNSTYLRTTVQIASILNKGYIQYTVQVYKMSDQCSTTDYIKYVMSAGSSNFTFDANTVQVANDLEMVEKVSNDPLGIGYCSTVFADPDRVTILAIHDTTQSPAKDYYWPSASKKFRLVVPSTRSASDWPWKRSLNLSYNAGTEATYIVRSLCDPYSSCNLQALYLGPLFKTGFWRGNYLPAQ